MATVEVRLPAFGMQMQFAYIVEWRVEVGSVVSAGDELVAIETDKVEAAIEAPVTGIVREIHGEPEDEVEVGALLAVIAELVGTGNGQ
jgi:pyruvate/2-oxoglutarate dehydrogenase complex dihydrolipoamide acyltransferase (E2) component